MFVILATKKQLVISQTDIDEAMIHLNSLPHTITKQIPKALGQEQFTLWLTESIPKTVNVGDSFSVATGIYGHILPAGYEYLYAPKDDRLQIALSIRKWQTDMDKLVEIKR